MFQKNQVEKKPPRLAMWAMTAAGVSVMLILLLTPWNFIPVEVTEDVTVIANVEYGCVGESQYGVSVVVSDCESQVGDVVSATFYVPAMKLNGYYDIIQDKVEMIQP